MKIYIYIHTWILFIINTQITIFKIMDKDECAWVPIGVLNYRLKPQTVQIN